MNMDDYYKNENHIAFKMEEDIFPRNKKQQQQQGAEQATTRSSPEN